MKTKLLILGALLALQCASTQAQIPITSSASAPATGAYDQYYLPGPVNEATNAMNTSGNGVNADSAANDGLTYVAADRSSKGQSFTTGSNPNGYTLSSVTVRHLLMSSFLGNGTWANVPDGASFAFQFGTISGSTLTPTLTTTATYSGTAISANGTVGTGTYLTFDLSGAGIATLSPNTTYFFELASASPWIELHNTRTNATSYTSGTAFAGNDNGALDSDLSVSLSHGEFAFVAKLAAIGAPSVVATVDPASGSVGQAFTVTATVTPGVGTVTNVSVNLSAIGGSAAASLVLSDVANVYTNTFTVTSGAPLGAANLTVTAKDTTPLTGSAGVLFTVLPSDRVWDGGSLVDSKWSSRTNWQGDLALALSGNNVFFAGTTRLTPDMDNNYSVSALVFSNTAGSFTISSSTGGTLTSGSGGIVNNSASAQTLNVPVVLGAAQTLDAAAGNLTLGQGVTKGGNLVTVTGTANTTISGSALGSGSLFKQGSGSLVISSNSTWDLGQAASGGFSGPLIAQSGTLVFNKGGSNTVAGELVIGGVVADGGDGNNAKIVVDNAILNVSSWLSVGRGNGIGGVSSDLVVTNGGVVTAQDFSAGYNAGNLANMPKGSITLSDTSSLTVSGGNFHLGESAGSDMTLNLNGGTLTVNQFTGNAGTGTLNFNGGTLKPTVSRTDFYPSGALTANVRNGGLTVDSTGFNITIGQPLAHSTNPDDNATDGGLTKVGNGTLTLSGGYSYTGPTKVLGGTLNLNPSLGIPSPGGDLVVSNATLVLDASSGTALPAANVTLKDATINLNYGTLSGTPAAAINAAGSLSASGANVINITGSGFVTGQQFPLIDYTGTAVPTNSFRLASLPPGVNAVLVNNAGNSSLDLLIGLAGNTLSWHGANADNTAPLTDWDINTSANWYDAVLNPVVYLQYNGNTVGDNVTFGDYAYDFDGDGTNSVNLPGRVVPATVTINNTTPYRLAGAGGIAGSTSVVKNNTGSFELGTSNNYTGGTMVNAGVLQIGNNSAVPASGSVTVNGTLDLNTYSPTIGNLSGSGIIDTVAGGSPTLTVSNSADSTFSGVIQNTAGTLALTKIGNGTLTLTAANTFSNGAVVVNAGTLYANIAGNPQYNANFSFVSGITVNSGATLEVAPNALFGWQAQAKPPITINAGGTMTADAGGDDAVGIVTLNGGTLAGGPNSGGWGSWSFGRATVNQLVATDNSTATATNMAFYNGASIDVAAGKTLTISGTIDDSNNGQSWVIKSGGTGTLVLSGANTYTGPTVINAGTLAGTGNIAGVLTNNATFAPGNGGPGTLTVAGDITLNAGSTNTFAVNGTTLAKSSVTAGASVTYGGVLNIVTNGSFTAGQQFRLFSGAGATNTGNFASLAGTPGSGLAFSFTNGVLSVIATGPSGPATLTNSFSGGVLSLSWPAGQGWRLQWQTNSLSTGLSTNWEYLTDGSVSSTNITVDAALPTVFYRLRHP